MTTRYPADRERVLLGSVVFAVLFAQVLLYPGIDTLVTALGAASVLGASTWFLAVELGASIVCVWVWGVLSDRRSERVPLLRLGAELAVGSYVTLAVLPHVPALGFDAALTVRAIQGGATVGVLSLASSSPGPSPMGPGTRRCSSSLAQPRSCSRWSLPRSCVDSHRSGRDDTRVPGATDIIKYF